MAEHNKAQVAMTKKAGETIGLQPQLFEQTTRLYSMDEVKRTELSEKES